MTIINAHINNPLKWIVLKGLSNSVEDFSRSKVMLFAISETNKIPLQISSKDDGTIVANISADFEIPTGLTAQTYDTELIWIKNGRDVNRTYQYNVFRVDTNSTALEQTVNIKSTALVYGYDGLSAYEIAMIKAENPISENEWLRNLLSEKANTTDLNAEIINRQTADTGLQDSINAINDKIPEAASSTNKLADKQFVADADNELRDRITQLDGSKADKNSVYTKQQVDDNFATKTSVYTKSEVNSALELKANKTALESAEYRISEAETDIESLQHRMNLAETDVDNIEATIPSLASSSNQLADKEFVNSSISTNTATFRGSYNLVTDLELAISASRETIAINIPNVVSSADNNDYAFVQIPVSDEIPTNIARVERYKFNGSEWAFEYELNNSGFTAEQWAAISSGVTSTHVLKVNGIDAELAGKLDVLTFDSAPTANSFNPVTSNGLYIALLNILSTSGGTINGTLTMHGNIDMLMDAQHSWNSIKTTTGRNLFCFRNGFNGYMIGDESIKLGIQTGSNNDVPTPIYHRIIVNGTAVDHPVLDTYNLPTNVKTINNTSVAGAGNIDINDAFKVVYGVTPIEDIVDAYKDGKYIYAAILNQDENSDVGSIYVLYMAYIDINTTNTHFGFSQYYGDGNDVSWFELTNDGYSEIYYGTIVTTSDLTSALSDYTTTSDLTTLLNNKQNTVDSDHKLSADVIDDSSATNKFVTSSDKTLWNTVTEKAPLPFVVHCGINPEDVPFVNNTLDEIWAAYQNGKNIRVKFTKADGISFEDDATILLDGSRNCVAHTVHNGTHHIVTIYDDNGTTKLSYEETHDSDKQDVISDLSTIRSGAAAGATAYQKPQSGIPASDIASGVIPDISNLANKSGSLSQDFAAKSLSVLGRGTSNGIKLYRSDGQIPYGRIIMESDLVNSGIDYMLPTTGVAEQSAVVLATKASVDAKYTKPSSGIPASDIAAGVIPDVSQFITRSVNDLVNYYTKSETYTQSEVDALISNMQKFHYEIYASLQDITTPATNVLYLIGPSGSGSDKYEEYVYANNSFVKIGDTSIDLSGYVTTQTLNTALANYVTSTDLTTLLSGKQDTLISGTNIKTINNTSVLGSGNLTLEDSSNKTNDIANNDTDTTKYPSCKAVADYVSDIVGNINSILETI